MCYIETSNLDGETNLKIRQVLPLTLLTSAVKFTACAVERLTKITTDLSASIFIQLKCVSHQVARMFAESITDCMSCTFYRP